MIQKKQNKIFKNELKKFKVKNLNLYLNRNKNKKSFKKFEEKFLIKVLKKIGKKDNN